MGKRKKQIQEARQITKSSTTQAKTKIKFISRFGSPSQINKQTLKGLHIKRIHLEEVTVASNLKIPYAPIDVLATLDHIKYNAFKDILTNSILVHSIAGFTRSSMDTSDGVCRTTLI